MLAGLGGLQPLGWDPPLIQLTALPAGRYRRDAPYRQRHSGFRELTHTKPQPDDLVVRLGRTLKYLE